MVEAIGDVNFTSLQGQADNLAEKGNQQPGLVGLFDGFRAGTPQLYADVDRVTLPVGAHTSQHPASGSVPGIPIVRAVHAAISSPV